MTEECPKTSNGQSNRSREENNSSGYVSEGSNETKTENKDELIKTLEIKVNIDEKNGENKDNLKVKTEVETEENEKKENEDKPKTETEENKIIKQSPVPKPPRLGTQNAARLDPQAYINFEIEPADKKTDKADTKQDTAQNENVNPSTDIKVQNTEPKTELKTQKNATENTNQLKTRSLENTNKDENTNQLEKRTTSTLPTLSSTDKRKAPEPPDATTNAKQTSGKASKKGECHLNLSEKRIESE